MTALPNRRRRIENALWGAFTGDALSMPVHWYYSRENIVTEFGGWITGYEDARHPHPEAFMVGMPYQPDVATAEKLGRPHDILHGHSRFYRTSYSAFDISTDHRESEHGNASPAPEDRYHYHHGLKAGDMTLNAQLIRVLMRSVIRSEGYSPDAFLEDLVSYMTTPRPGGDPYVEIYLRRWFENYCSGRPIHACARRQREQWSIGSHGGMPGAMMIGLMAPSAYQGTGMALEHQVLTHRSENVASALALLVPLLHDLVEGADLMEAAGRMAGTVRMPGITGEAMFTRYREAQGPGNIDPVDMWGLHTRYQPGPVDLDALKEKGPDAVIRKLIGTACYPEHGLPLMLYILAETGGDFRSALLLNANAGGDNVGRAHPLGMILGAACDDIPHDLKTGLTEHQAIDAEIRAFSEIAAGGEGFLAHAL